MSMLLLTAVGPDKPGMAHAVAEILFRSGCNIEDSTMTRLSGQFAMILVVSPPPTLSQPQLAGQLESLRQSHGLTIDLTVAQPQAAAPSEESTRYMVSLYGPEARGLLARITEVLAQHEANITDVQTRVASGGLVYVMLLEIELKTGASPQALQEHLLGEATAAGLQLSLRALEPETL